MKQKTTDLTDAAASAVDIAVIDLPDYGDTYQHVKGFPNASDAGMIAETTDGKSVGAAWVRMLLKDAQLLTSLCRN